MIKLSTAADDWDWSADNSNLFENGWGFVIRQPTGKTYYACGRIPPRLLSMFTARRAFVYSLEIIAQMLAIISGRHLLTQQVWSFCDNEPGRCAMEKGFGRDVRVNRMLSCMWQYLQLSGISPAFQRAPVRLT